MKNRRKKSEKEIVKRKIEVPVKKLRLKATKLAVSAKEKASVRRKLEVPVKKLRLKATKLAVSAKKKEGARRRLVVTAKGLKQRASKLAVTARGKEGVRRKLVVKAKGLKKRAHRLAETAKVKESVRRRVEITARELKLKAKQLAVTAREKESVRRKLEVTAEKLSLKARQLAVTASEKESIRRKLEVTARELKIKANKLAVTAKEKEEVRRRLAVTDKKLALTAKEKEEVRRKLAVTADELAVTAKEKEEVRRKLAVTAEELAVTAKEKEEVRRELAVTAEKLAVTAKEKEEVRRELAVTAEKLAVTAKEKEEVRLKLAVNAKVLAVSSKERETMLASIGDGLLATDSGGNITLINKTAEKLLGRKSEEVMGRVFFEVFPIEDENGASIQLEKHPVSMALSTATTTTTTTTAGPTYYYAHKDKSKFPVAITVTPVILDGKVIGTIEVFRDITLEKEIDKAKSEFISLASHQLKTPPTAIKLLTERLLGGKMGMLTEKQNEYINDIRALNQRMIDLVNALLNVSRIELGAFTIKVKEMDIGATIQIFLNELKPLSDKKHLKLKIILPEKKIELMLDEPLFRSVISNMVMNSIHYTPEDGEISIECKIMNKGEIVAGKLFEEKSFLIVVSDSGYGIPQNQQGKVFTKFFRADNAREVLADGTGLGLYLVKSVLDNSGGFIWFTSGGENQGSTFYAAIPMTGMRAKAGKKELELIGEQNPL